MSDINLKRRLLLAGAPASQLAFMGVADAAAPLARMAPIRQIDAGVLNVADALITSGT